MKRMKRLAPLLLSAALLGAAPVQAAGALTRGEAAHEQTPGTAEAKIKALYDCVMDTDGREKAGVAPSKSIWTPSRTPQL